MVNAYNILSDYEDFLMKKIQIYSSILSQNPTSIPESERYEIVSGNNNAYIEMMQFEEQIENLLKTGQIKNKDLRRINRLSDKLNSYRGSFASIPVVAGRRKTRRRHTRKHKSLSRKK